MDEASLTDSVAVYHVVSAPPSVVFSMYWRGHSFLSSVATMFSVVIFPFILHLLLNPSCFLRGRKCPVLSPPPRALSLYSFLFLAFAIFLTHTSCAFMHSLHYLSSFSFSPSSFHPALLFHHVSFSLFYIHVNLLPWQSVTGWCISFSTVCVKIKRSVVQELLNCFAVREPFNLWRKNLLLPFSTD